MKELYYAGIPLEKDLGMCEIYDEIEANPGSQILRHGRNCLIHELVYDKYGRERTDTGVTHIGFDFHYIVFSYKGFIFDVEPAMNYPFTDENHPGMYNFAAYGRCGDTRERQLTYRRKYEGLKSIDDWLSNKAAMFERRLSRSLPKRIDIRVSDRDYETIKEAVQHHGGYREREVFKKDPLITSTETWNANHKVVSVVAGEAEPDGHRDSFDFDLVTKHFC